MIVCEYIWVCVCVSYKDAQNLRWRMNPKFYVLFWYFHWFASMCACSGGTSFTLFFVKHMFMFFTWGENNFVITLIWRKICNFDWFCFCHFDCKLSDVLVVVCVCICCKLRVTYMFILCKSNVFLIRSYPLLYEHWANALNQRSTPTCIRLLFKYTVIKLEFKYANSELMMCKNQLKKTKRKPFFECCRNKNRSNLLCIIISSN